MLNNIKLNIKKIMMKRIKRIVQQAIMIRLKMYEIVFFFLFLFQLLFIFWILFKFEFFLKMIS